MPRTFFLPLFLLLYGLPLCAQQTQYTAFYRNNWQSVNPAAIDRSFYLKRYHNTTLINAGSRLQWIGLDGAPLNYFVSAEYCPELSNNEANNKFGFTAYGDKTDAISTYALYGNYSYFFTLPRDGHILHFGISPGLVVYGVDATKLRDQNGQPTTDPTALENKQRVFADFAFGMMYRIRKQFYFGLSVPQTFGLNLKQRNAKGIFDTDRRQHLNLQVGAFINRGQFDYGIEGPTIVLEPSAIMRVAPGVTFNTLFPSLFSLDANLRVHLMKPRVYGGLGVGTNGIISAEAGFNRDLGEGAKIQIGMAYGLPAFQKYLRFGHSVELNMSYYFL
ncbi:MAG TPA: PorP/SprF family type IX secretion system membrane protein [Saprospiraceae bacterium]|nr:PorP/SprF family type IX secretion system membrane protein [Saprospiraceae bacterium]HNG90057.1 PorP/SprF family type IX secretion system membrane protein [Saprospiraceae bacterium]